MESALVVTSWFEDLKSELGISGVSQVWCDHPAWYFWVNHAPGVYLLALTGVDLRVVDNREILFGAFVIKCYPYPGHSLFSQFAARERELVQSTAFDKTYSPAFEARKNIPDDLFNVAAFSLCTDRDHCFNTFSFESFDRLIAFSSSDKERIERDVPGITVGYPLFDTLVCMLMHCEKQAPARIRLYRSPGFECLADRGAACWQPSDLATGYHLVVDCTGVGNHGSERVPDILPELYHAAGASLLYDQVFSGNHFHPGEMEQRLPVGLNPKWWKMAEAIHNCQLASSCGCH